MFQLCSLFKARISAVNGTGVCVSSSEEQGFFEISNFQTLISKSRSSVWSCLLIFMSSIKIIMMIYSV